jgi:hypothetical protein
MKLLLALLTVVLLGWGVTACGGASKGVGSASRASSNAAATGRALATIALETPNPHEDNDDDRTIYVYGHAASAADRQAVTAVVKRYYVAAAADDGATACSLIVSTLARAIPEDYGQASGPSYLRGGETCQAIMLKMFIHFHSQLAGTIEVTGVRVKRNHAFALLRSSTFPFVYTELEHEGGVWKVQRLLGAVLP